MFGRWFRTGIRSQIIFIVIIGAVLTTAATLIIADTSITQYGNRQARAEASRNLKIADHIRTFDFGASVSISDEGDMGNLVVDSPTVSHDNYTVDKTYNDFGRLPLNNDTKFVDEVQAQLGDAQVSVYQCANKLMQQLTGGCQRISTTFTLADGTTRAINTPSSPQLIPPNVLTAIHNEVLSSGFAAYPQTIGGIQYMVGYQLLFDPQQDPKDASQLPIGLLVVAQPLTQINQLISTTTLFMILTGIAIMITGLVMALIVASAISNTLQRASKQVGVASDQLSDLSSRQSSGSSQQVWAINAINRGLQNLKESSDDIARRTDQLAQLGTQVALRRAEITPTQLEAIMGHMTRAVLEINVSSRNHATTVERMTNAMEAVTEVADQVAGGSRQMAESSERLETVVMQLEELVTGRRSKTTATNQVPPTVKAGQRPMDDPLPSRGGSRSGALNGTLRPAMSLPDATHSNAPMLGSRMNEAAMPGNGRGAMGQMPMIPAPRGTPSRPNPRDSSPWQMRDDDPRRP